ncbi:hypothetical protein DQ04_05781020 [Trypanosoma grayi]|uniref:hypothetical protein n=1 Tax=Trypanosoma grayi TaxID=71804 RepID=UPI0004F407A0|nr:hypothetical protein DQ04_05781020 [Trypanosoma grayi]KEG09115.1 hypothetical protein DQ04_05781020 [Trypanosoma grayi]
MPSKKKSTAHDAEKAEAARQAELRKLAEEQERLRKLEEEARQRLVEEWSRAMDAHRQRQMDIQRAITERELRLAFEVREEELRDTIEQKGCEVRELRARLNGLQQGTSTMQQELESTLRRVSMLGNELELSQMKLVETEALLERKDRETHAQLRELEHLHDAEVDAHRALKVEHERLRRAYEEQQAQLTLLQTSGDSGDLDARLASVKPQSSDAETALLLKVLHEEVEKHREVARLLQAELERKGRDDEKGSVLISLLNSQLEASRDECKRLHETSTDRRRQLEAVQSLLDSERDRTKSLHRDLDTAYAEATVERRQLSLEIGVHTAQVGELTKTLERTSAELAEVKEQFDAHRAKATEREQYDFQVNVALKGEVEQLKKDLARTTEELRVAGDDAYTKKALLRAEIDSLKTRLQKLQENAERNERESFETIAVLRATSERLEEEKRTLTETTEANTRKLRDDLLTVCAERDAARAHAQELQTQKDAVEKDLFERLLRMTASHDQLHEELQRVTSRYAGREKEFLENAIFLNAERETLRAKVEELSDTLSQRAREHAQHVQGITDDLAALKTRAEEQLTVRQRAQEKEAARATNAEAEVAALQQRVAELEVQLETRQRERQRVEQLLKGEARELRVELSAAKRSIERFECALGDASYKSLREANDSLRRDLEQQREKVAVLNDTIASMKVESTIMESYKEKMLSDQNEQYARRIQQQEKMRQAMNPLFYELRSIVEKNGLAGPLRRDLDAYDEQLRRSRPPAPPPSEKRISPQASAEKSAAAAAVAVIATGTTTNAKGAAPSAEERYSTLPAVAHPRRLSGDSCDRTHFVPQKPSTAQPQQQFPSIFGSCTRGEGSS